MMTCRCVTDILRSFIQDVAQVGLPPIPMRRLRFPALDRRLRSTRSYLSTLSRARSTESKPYVEISLEGINKFSADEKYPGRDIDQISRRDTAQLSESLKAPTPPIMNLLTDSPKKKKKSQPTVPRTESVSISDERVSVKGLPNLRLSNVKKKTNEDEKWTPPPRQPWMIEKERVKTKYPNGYSPLKKVSSETMEEIRALHSQMPEFYTTAVIANEFQLSPEAIRRILKSKWRPTPAEADDRKKRWEKRGEAVWSRWAELGATPPRKYRNLGIGRKPLLYHYEPESLPELVTKAVERKPVETAQYFYEAKPLPSLGTAQQGCQTMSDILESVNEKTKPGTL